MKENNYDTSKSLLNKVKENYKEYDFESRLVPQVKSAQKKIKYLIDKNSENKKSQKNAAATSNSNEKNYAIKNFYV